MTFCPKYSADGAHVLASAPVEYRDRYGIFITNDEILASTLNAAAQDSSQRTDA